MKLSSTEIHHIKEYLASHIKLNDKPIKHDDRFLFQLIQNDDDTLSIVIQSANKLPIDDETIEKLISGIAEAINLKKSITKFELTSPLDIKINLSAEVSKHILEIILINKIGDAPAAIQFIKEHTAEILQIGLNRHRVQLRFLLAIQMFLSPLGISTTLKEPMPTGFSLGLNKTILFDEKAESVFFMMVEHFFSVKVNYRESTILIQDINYFISSDCMQAVEEILKHGVPPALQGLRLQDQAKAEEHLNTNYPRSSDNNHHEVNELKGIIWLEGGNESRFQLVSSLINIKTREIFHTKINTPGKVHLACHNVGLLRRKLVSPEQKAKSDAEFQDNIQKLQGRVKALLGVDERGNINNPTHLKKVLTCLQAPACSEISVTPASPPYRRSHYIRGIDENAVTDAVNKQVKEPKASYTSIQFQQDDYKGAFIITLSSKEERVTFAMDVTDISCMLNNMPTLVAANKAKRDDNKMASLIAQERKYRAPQDSSPQKNASENPSSEVDSYNSYAANQNQ